MREIPVGNGLVAIVDDDIFEAVSGFEWVLKDGKPFLKEMQPTWEGSRSLHRHVMNVQDARRWVTFRSGYTLDCRRENLFAGTPSQCAAFWRLNPGPEPERKSTVYCGVIWAPHVRGWTVDYERHQLPTQNPQYFREAADAAREFDRCLMAKLAWKNAQVVDFKAKLAEKELELEDLQQAVQNLVNFPVTLGLVA